MKVLVTGGSGYVGRALCRRLLPEHELHVLDSFRFGRSRFAAEEAAGARVHACNLDEAQAVSDCLESVAPDAVIHLAAVHYIPECEADPRRALATNVTGTVNLLSACPAGSRVIVMSSAAVYEPSERPHRESDPTVQQPVDMYGLTKLHCESYTRYFARERDFSAVLVRLFNVVGPGETNPHLVPEIVAQALAGKNALALGNTTPKRDFIHVQDVAEGLDRLLLAPTVPRREAAVLNLGTGTAHSVEELVTMLSVIAGRDISIETDPARVRAVDRPHLCADTTQLEEALGWKPTRSLADAILDLWKSRDLPTPLLERYAENFSEPE
jgi:UDP-glucose 4-epimerase